MAGMTRRSERTTMRKDYTSHLEREVVQVIPGGAEEHEFRAGDQRGSRQSGSPGSRQTGGQGWACLQSKMGQ